MFINIIQLKHHGKTERQGSKNLKLTTRGKGEAIIKFKCCVCEMRDDSASDFRVMDNFLKSARGENRRV